MLARANGTARATAASTSCGERLRPRMMIRSFSRPATYNSPSSRNPASGVRRNGPAPSAKRAWKVSRVSLRPAPVTPGHAGGGDPQLADLARRALGAGLRVHDDRPFLHRMEDHEVPQALLRAHVGDRGQGHLGRSAS